MTTPINDRTASGQRSAQSAAADAAAARARPEGDPHSAFVKLGTEATDHVVSQAEFSALAPLAPAAPSIGPACKIPFAGNDAGGLFAGLDQSDGKRALSCLVYGSDTWFSAHSEAGYRQASGDEVRGGGFVGTDGRDFAQLSMGGSYYHAARRIGGRLGGGIFVSPKKSTVDITPLDPAKRPADGARLLRTTHVRRRFNVHGLLGFAALSFLRLFLRIERRNPVTIVWDHLERDPAKARAATGADRHPLRAGIAARVNGFRDGPTGPALRDCMTALSNGESLTYTCAQQRGFLGMVGLYASAGQQKHSLVRSEIKVARADDRVTVTLQRTTDVSRSWFGILPGGALAAREWHTPTVEQWTYAFNAAPGDRNEATAYQALIDEAFDPERGIRRERLQSGLDAPQLQSHVETERGTQTQNELGLHVMQPQWLVKRWLPKHFQLGFGNHTGKLVTTARITPKQGAATRVDTRERRNQATRGGDGLLQEILTSRFIRPAEGTDLTRAHLLLRVKHKQSHVTPQALQRTVVGPLACMLGISMGGLVAEKTPEVASPHALNVGLDLQVPQLMALAQFQGRDLPDALPDPTLRQALQRCIDGWGGPERVRAAPLEAFESLRDLMESTADRSTEDATLLLGALGFLLHQAGQGGAVELTHKATLYREPTALAGALQAKYGDQPMQDLRAIRQRFREVRQALVRVDYARYLLQDDSADPTLRAEYAPKMEQAVDTLRSLLHVENDAEREAIVERLQASWWSNAHDAYILAVLCANKPGHLAQDPLRKGRALHATWATYANRAAGKQQRNKLVAALQAQSKRMGEPGFPYSDEATRGLRQALRTLESRLTSLQ